MYSYYDDYTYEQMRQINEDWRMAIDEDWERNEAILLIQRAYRSYMLRKKTRAALKIQRAFKLAISDPNYLICRTRLLREYSGLVV